MYIHLYVGIVSNALVVALSVWRKISKTFNSVEGVSDKHLPHTPQCYLAHTYTHLHFTPHCIAMQMQMTLVVCNLKCFWHYLGPAPSVHVTVTYAMLLPAVPSHHSKGTPSAMLQNYCIISSNNSSCQLHFRICIQVHKYPGKYRHTHLML